MLRQILPQRLIDHGRIVKNIGEIWIEENHVRTLHVTLVVRATNAASKIHFRNVVFFQFFAHKLYQV